MLPKIQPFARRRTRIGAAVVLLLPAAALAHDFWIEPDEFRPVAGTEFDVRLREGVAFKGNTLPYLTSWFKDFSVIDASGKSPVQSIQGNDPAATLTAVDSPMLLVYQSSGSNVKLDAKKFNAYLEEEGMEFLRERRRAAGQDEAPAAEHFVRYAKSFVMPVDATGGEGIYATRLNYPLELVPESDPYAARAGDTLRFRLLKMGAAGEGLLVQAYTREEPERVQRIRVGPDGVAEVELHSPGVWMVKAVNIEPFPENLRVASRAYRSLEWLSHWATFTFELPAATAEGSSGGPQDPPVL